MSGSDTPLEAATQTGASATEAASYIPFSTSTPLINSGFGGYDGPTIYGGISLVNTANTTVPVFDAGFPAADRLGSTGVDAISANNSDTGNAGTVRTTYSAIMGNSLATVAYSDLFSGTYLFTGSSDNTFRGSALLVQLSNSNIYVSENIGWGAETLNAADFVALDWALFTPTDTFGTDSDLRVTLPTNDDTSTMADLGLDSLDVSMIGVYGYSLAGSGGTTNAQAQLRYLTIDAVPEPAAFSLLMGVAALALIRRHRQRV